jgi:hypothetical protein
LIKKKSGLSKSDMFKAICLSKYERRIKTLESRIMPKSTVIDTWAGYVLYCQNGSNKPVIFSKGIEALINSVNKNG